MRTITAESPGPGVLSITAEAAEVTVTATPEATVSTVVLTPATEGDAAAAAVIASARIVLQGTLIRIRLTYPPAPTAAPGDHGGGVHIGPGATVVAATIGGTGNHGSVTGPVTIGGRRTRGPAPLVRITATVPAGTRADAWVSTGSVTMSGPLTDPYADPGPVIDMTGVTAPE